MRLPDSWTQTVFINNRIKAPAAISYLSFANKIAKLAAGGKSATDTITPTREADMPVVIESAAAAPDANAKTISPSPTFVRDIISLLNEFISEKNEIEKVIPNVNAMPMINDLSDDMASFFEPIVAAKDNAKLGPNSGAITIAPTTTAMLSSDRPIVATIEERITIKT